MKAKFKIMMQRSFKFKLR